ncbi:MAG TPA: CvpA family protein [Candidatus Limnocylindria bacterium]|nr:CvpA family protein [Candidatus Limnocylindria bacterium]
MNIVDIILVAAIGISVIYGFYHGFIQSVASLLGTGVAILSGFLFGPRLAQAVSGNASITGILSNFSDAFVRVGDAEVALSPVTSVSGGMLDNILNIISLPAPIEDALRNNILTRAFQGQGLATVNDYVSNTLVQAAIGVLSFLACCVAGFLVWTILVSLVRHVFEFPILRQLDWLAGGLFGFARGVVLCFLLVLLIPLIQVVIPDNAVVASLETSSVAGLFRSDGFFARVIGGL